MLITYTCSECAEEQGNTKYTIYKHQNRLKVKTLVIPYKNGGKETPAVPCTGQGHSTTSTPSPD